MGSKGRKESVLTSCQHPECKQPGEAADIHRSAAVKGDGDKKDVDQDGVLALTRPREWRQMCQPKESPLSTSSGGGQAGTGLARHAGLSLKTRRAMPAGRSSGCGHG